MTFGSVLATMAVLAVAAAPNLYATSTTSHAALAQA
ncbi:hypothetical protein Save01_09194 [Streptomyces avermitilis]